MRSIQKENRKQSYILRPIRRAEAILEAMGDDPMTAREIMIRMGFGDMNMVRPRITELEQAGKIQALGKAYDMTTKRNVTVWRANNG